MATRDEVIQAIRSADATGDSESVRKLGAYLQSMLAVGPAAKPAPEPDGSSFGSRMLQHAGNLAAGAVRGAGSIGATVLAPVDAAARAVGIENDFIGRDDRRAGMDGALKEMGAQPDSLTYQGGKMAAEVAGTAGAGGALARGAVALAPGVSAAVPGLVNAVRTGGMAAGPAAPGFVGGAANLATRAAGGAVTGGTSAAMVDPHDAATGAVIGAALPGALKAAGAVGSKIGQVVRGPAQAADLAPAIDAARQAGYVIPPTQANPTLANRLLEGLSGKISTAQSASTKNQAVTNRLSADALGLPAGTRITPEVLADLRKQAGQAYEAVGNSGTITPTKTYFDALDAISAPYVKASQGFPNAKPSAVLELIDSLRSPNFDASSAVAKIKELRSTADDAFRTGSTDTARAAKAAAGALETAIETHLARSGNQAQLDAFREGRTLIAKTYSVEKALNQTSGNVDARKLASQLARGKPLSDGLRDAAEFSARFPKATQTVEGMGSLPQTSPLDWAAGSGLSVASGNPLMMAGIAARPAARAAALSDFVQNRLVQDPATAGALARLFATPGVARLPYQAAPILATDR